MTAEALSADAITARLAAAPDAAAFVRRVLYHPQIGSTNDACRALAEHGAPEGVLVVADEQSAGRGRLGRGWVAPPEAALLASLLFRPALEPAQATRLAMVCALAAAEGVEACTGLRPALKWPNDLLIGEDKFAGLLAETGLTGERLEYVIVGLGLNVNFDPQTVAGTGPRATSLQCALGRRVDRLELLVAILARIATRYAALQAGAPVLADWRARLVTLGRRVSVTQGDRRFDGLAETVDDDGALVVRLDDGTRAAVQAGDVTLRPNTPG